MFSIKLLSKVKSQYSSGFQTILGVTTENGKNSTLSDLVFVKVIDN